MLASVREEQRSMLSTILALGGDDPLIEEPRQPFFALVSLAETQKEVL